MEMSKRKQAHNRTCNVADCLAYSVELLITLVNQTASGARRLEQVRTSSHKEGPSTNMLRCHRYRDTNTEQTFILFQHW